MSKIETINNELIDMGFTINDSIYTLEQTSAHTIIINGRRMVQEEKHILRMDYIGDGCELDENNNEIEGTEICGFDVKDEDGNSLTTIYISSGKDLLNFINI